MNEILDNNLKITVFNHPNNPNQYYLTYHSDMKCMIDTMYIDNDVIIVPEPNENCTVEELNKLIDYFSDFIFKLKPELNGMLLKTEEDSLLESIGFKLLSKDSEYLYKKNKLKNKVR